MRRAGAASFGAPPLAVRATLLFWGVSYRGSPLAHGHAVDVIRRMDGDEVRVVAFLGLF